jgi:hypothetical protein
MVIADYFASACPRRAMGRDQRGGIDLETVQRFRVGIGGWQRVIYPRALTHQDAAALVGRRFRGFF